MSDHGLTARKTTLTGLRQRLDHEVSRPEPVSTEEWKGLTDAERLVYDDERLRWLGSGLWVQTPHIVGLLRSVRAQLRTADDLTVGESGILLTGPAHIGKTTALWKVALQVEQRVARLNPLYRDHGIVPVVYIEVPPKASPKTMAAQIVEFFGTPYNFHGSNQHQILTLAIDLLRTHRTQVLIIDELQMLRLDSRSGDAAINTLKTLMNSTGAVLVFAGVDLLTQLSSRPAEQIIARCEVLKMSPFSAGSDAGRRGWASLVARFGNEMMLLGAEHDHLAPWADPLLLHTGGSIGTLRRLLVRALSTVIDERDDDAAATAPGGCAEDLDEGILFGLGYGVSDRPTSQANPTSTSKTSTSKTSTSKTSTSKTSTSKKRAA